MKSALRTIVAFAMIGGMGGCETASSPADYGGGFAGYSAWAVENFTPVGLIGPGLRQINERRAAQARSQQDTTHLYNECIKNAQDPSVCDAQFGKAPRGVAGIE